MLEKMHETSFDWLSWRGEGVIRIGIVQREAIILSNAHIIKKYAIGYCPAENIICRPKKDCVAVMFLKDDDQFWTHLTRKEFDIIFPKESKSFTTMLQKLYKEVRKENNHAKPREY